MADTSAPPSPWIARAVTSTTCEDDTPHTTDASVKSVMPIRKRRRRP